MVDYGNNINGYVNNNINSNYGLAYAPDNNNNNNNNNRFQNMAGKLNTIQNMFFNNNPNGINLPTNNNLFNNQTSNNPNSIDVGYLDNFDQNSLTNNNLNSNNNNNFNPTLNNHFQANQDMNINNNTANKNFSNVNNNNLTSNTPIDSDSLKKKTFMEGIQQQIQNNKNTKLQELLKKKLEDQKYLADMNTYNPFGRNGAGAPLRDNTGKIITRRRALITDNKKLNDSIEHIKDESVNPGNSKGNNMHLNNLINNLTQKISAYGTENIGNGIVPRYNSARVAVTFLFNLFN